MGISNILEKSVLNPDINRYGDLKLEYKYKLNDGKDDNNNLDEDSFEEQLQSITDHSYNVKNLKIFPYITVGTISIKFPLDDKKYEYTCFAIFTNIIVTL